MKNFSKLTAISFFAVYIVASSSCAKADTWGANMMASMFSIKVRIIYETIYGVMMGALKQSAAQAINKTINQAMSSGSTSQDESASTKFISNWNEFLYTYPQQKAEVYMNDFFSSVSSGKQSALNYTSSAGKSVAGGYMQQLVRNTKNNLGLESSGSSSASCEISDPTDIFQNGDWTKFNSLYSNDICNQFGLTLISESVYSQKVAMLTEEAKTKAIANQGFKSEMSGNSVTTPGSILKDIESQAQDLPNKIIAGAQNLPEVITSIATRMVMNTIQQGIGKAKAQATKAVNSQLTKVNNKVQQSVGINPQIKFKPKY